MGKLIVLEGLDGSGKSTQLDLLCGHYAAQALPHRKISFPDYDQPSSSLIKMYLAGDFSDNPESVNPYAVSAFYACDRFASFQRFWQQDYLAGQTILCGRYTTSNLIYQMVKLPLSEWKEFILWTEDFEYCRLGLPRPDLVLFFDMPPEVSQNLLSSRYQGDESKKDVHEKNTSFLSKCRKAAFYAAENLGWKVIECAENGEKPLSPDIILKKVLFSLD